MKLNFKYLVYTLAFAALSAANMANAQNNNDNGGFASGTSDDVQVATGSVASLDDIIRGAEEGDKIMQNMLGHFYLNGNEEVGVEQDYDQAFKWLGKAYENGSIKCIGALAKCYRYGYGTQPDSLQAATLYKEAASKVMTLADANGENYIVNELKEEAENGESLFSALVLVDIYRNGYGVKKSPSTSYIYMKKAAELGHVKSMYDYGRVCFAENRYDEATEWYAKAAEQGHVTATYLYGSMLFQGRGVGQDKQKAMECFEMAADNGNYMANYELGRIYLDADGVDADPDKAVAYLQKAAPYYKLAAWRLGECYKNGVGVNRNYAFAAHWMAESMDDSQNCRQRVEKMLDDDKDGPFTHYLKGLYRADIDNNYEEAVAFFKKVEKAKVTEGSVMVALIMANSQYSGFNAKKAFKAMEKAAETDPMAKYYLSRFYKEGIGVAKDNDKALQLLKEASNMGVGEAHCDLADLYMEGVYVPQDLTMAAVLYLEAEKMHKLNPDAAKKLAKCYVQQIAALPDLDEAQDRVKKLNEWKQNDNMPLLLAKVSFVQ